MEYSDTSEYSIREMNVLSALRFTTTLAIVAAVYGRAKADFTQFSAGYCTRYAAQRFDSVAPSPLCNWNGNASAWFTNASANGWETVASPYGVMPGSIMVWTDGGQGHVAFVESTTSSTVSVSEMNWTGFNQISYATLPLSNLTRGTSGQYTFLGYILPYRQGGRTPMYRYMNDVLPAHFFTTTWSELGGGAGDWRYEGVGFKVGTVQLSGWVPLYRARSANNGTHFYSVVANDIFGNPNWIYEGVEGYVFPSTAGYQPAGMVPLYRYDNSATGDYLYTDVLELGNGSGTWSLAGIAAYVYPK